MPALHNTQTFTAKTRVSGVKAVLRLLQAWDMRRKTRRDLRALDTHLLRDIGMPAEMHAAECAKHFWQD